jgi:hypothetical protein
MLTLHSTPAIQPTDLLIYRDLPDSPLRASEQRRLTRQHQLLDQLYTQFAYDHAFQALVALITKLRAEYPAYEGSFHQGFRDRTTLIFPRLHLDGIEGAIGLHLRHFPAFDHMTHDRVLSQRLHLIYSGLIARLQAAIPDHEWEYDIQLSGRDFLSKADRQLLRSFHITVSMLFKETQMMGH